MLLHYGAKHTDCSDFVALQVHRYLWGGVCLSCSHEEARSHFVTDAIVLCPA